MNELQSLTVALQAANIDKSAKVFLTMLTEVVMGVQEDVKRLRVDVTNIVKRSDEVNVDLRRRGLGGHHSGSGGGMSIG